MLTHEQKIEWMAVWCAKNNLRLVLDGNVGFGRECVGISAEQNYPEYEWYDEDYNIISDNGDVWAPEDAYHKHPCVAVLGLGEKAEAQLYDWLQWFDQNGFKMELGDNPIEDLQSLGVLGLLMNKHRYVRMVKTK